MLENEEIYQALQLVRESAFTPGEREAYKEYWLNVSTEKTALEESRKEGREEGEAIGMEKGRKEGREEGRKEEKIEIAKKLKGKGMDVEGIVEMTGLTRDEIEGL
jgi:predicted transposase YdaD